MQIRDGTEHLASSFEAFKGGFPASIAASTDVCQRFFIRFFNSCQACRCLTLAGKSHLYIDVTNN